VPVGIGEKHFFASSTCMYTRVVCTRERRSGPDASGDKMTCVCIVIRDNGGATCIAGKGAGLGTADGSFSLSFQRRRALLFRPA